MNRDSDSGLPEYEAEMLSDRQILFYCNRYITKQITTIRTVLLLSVILFQLNYSNAIAKYIGSSQTKEHTLKKSQKPLFLPL
jgi:hypothetical protein